MQKVDRREDMSVGQVAGEYFGPWLRYIRECRGISASKMCRTLDMAWSHYHALEKGQYGAPRDFGRLQTIADMLQISRLEVYDRAGVIPPDLMELVTKDFGEWLEIRQQVWRSRRNFLKEGSGVGTQAEDEGRQAPDSVPGHR